MPKNSKKEVLKAIKKPKYLNKDFDGFKSDLNEYNKTHHSDANQDTSETGVAGMFMEMAAYIGDVQSFYLDHQFHELNPETATEDKNIEAHLRDAGVEIVGSSPAVVEQTFLIEVPAEGSPAVPSATAIPIIHAGTIVPGGNGVFFELTEDLDFSETDDEGNMLAEKTIGNVDANSNPTSFILSRFGNCISGFTETESFSVGNFTPYKKFTISKENVTEIKRVVDSLGNEYYQVGHLTEDTVFEAIPNRDSDAKIVEDNLFIKPAPYRFTSATSLQTRLSTLTFGGGSAASLDDDIVPDPSEFAIPLYGKKNFSRFTLNPANLLQTTTLGVIAPNTTLSVEYRYGGGLSHNLAPEQIRGYSTLVMTFPNDPSPNVAQFVRSSADSINAGWAAGGEDPPTRDELKSRIPAVKFAQDRTVSKEDLLARIYTMPANLGRVFRASVRPNPTNNQASNVYIISRNSSNQLILSPDTLKINLEKYLNKYRLTSDAIDILDAQVVNFTVEFTIATTPGANRQLVRQNIIKRLTSYFGIKNFEIDQPIIVDDVKNIIFNNEGVLSVSNLKLKNITGTVSTGPNGNTGSTARVYSGNAYNLTANTEKNIVFPPVGGIFEIRYPAFDIRGATT